MKIFVKILTLAFLSASPVALHAAQLNGSDIFISGIVKSIEPLCPLPGTCLVDGSRVNLEFNLPGSCFQITQFEYRVFNNSQSVEVTAVQSDLSSPERMCTYMVIPVQKSIQLIDVYPPFQLSFTSDSNLSSPIKVLK